MNPRKLQAMKAVADYFPCLRAQAQDVCGLPNNATNNRVFRQFLLDLLQEKYIGKTRMEVVSSMGAAAPAYFLLQKGAEKLAAEVDESYLHLARATPNWQFLLHWVKCTDFKIVLDRAIAAQEEVCVGSYLGEWDANEEGSRIFSLLRKQPRLVCNPDIGFSMCRGEKRRVYYVEVDRETSGIQQIAASKTPGYAELLKQQGHKKQFDTNMDTFNVLSISPSPGRRDLLRKAVKSKEASELWRFAAWPEFTPETTLHGTIWYPCEGDGSPLLRASVAASAGSPP